jgi:hypothetical protein
MLDSRLLVMILVAVVSGCVPPSQNVQPGYPGGSAPNANLAPDDDNADGDGDGDGDGDTDDDRDASSEQVTWPSQPGGGMSSAGAPPPAGAAGAPAMGGAPASAGGGAGAAGATGVRSDDCRVQVLAPNPSGGCQIRLVTPSPCETVDLTGNRTYEVAWTTDGSGCETPWTIQVAGNPITPDNIRSAQISTNVEQGITRKGGLLNITAADLAGLRSDNGLYHWSVQSHYGSHPGTNTFKVRR